MTEAELAVVRAAVDLVEYWQAALSETFGVHRVNGPSLDDLENKLIEAVIEYGRHD